MTPKFETTFVSMPYPVPYNKQGMCDEIAIKLNEGWTCLGVSLVGVVYTAFFSRQIPAE